MAWIEQKPGWLGRGAGGERRPKGPAPRRVTPDEAPLWTVADIARVLQIHEDTVRKLIENMPAGAVVRIGPARLVRVRDWAVQRLIEEV